MRPLLRFLLVASLAANLGLGLGLWWKTQISTAHPTAEGGSADPASQFSKTDSFTPNSSKLGQLLATASPAQIVSWLRAAGISPEKIARIVDVLLDEKYAQLRDKLQHGKTIQPYWRNFSYGLLFKQDREQLNLLFEQRSKEEAHLLGPDIWFSDASPYVNFIRRQYGSLSPEKLSAIQALQREYSAMTGSTPSVLSSGDQQKSTLLQKEFHADLAKILTPDELYEHDLRDSPSATTLQSRCNYFAATEDEYRALFSLYQQIDRTFPESVWDEPDEKTEAARTDAEAKMQGQIEALLGSERYAEFRQGNDKNSEKENRLVTSLGLPLSAAARLVQIKAETSACAELLKKDNSISQTERLDRLASLKTSTESSIASAIGDRGVEAYRQYGGTWLQTLIPQSSTKSKTTSSP